MKPIGKRPLYGLTRKRLLAAASLLALAGICALAACSPQAATTTAPSGDEKPVASEETSTTGYANFKDTDTGLFPDTEYGKVLNSGNRGCNSCHYDLWTIVADQCNTEAEKQSFGNGHLGSTKSGHYGKRGTVEDCVGCHSGRAMNTGPYLADITHSIHYQSEQFEEVGNCWSCHALNTEEWFTDTNDYSWVLWEQIMYEPTLGGTSITLTNKNARKFINEWRGFGTFNLSGVAVEEEPVIDVSMDQQLSDVKDHYIVDNIAFDESILKDEVVVEGVANPGTYTLEQLGAMPQTTVRSTEQCDLNVIGGTLLGNLESTGVTLGDLLEACGGLASPDMNTVTIVGYDGWTRNYNLEQETLDGVVTLMFNGEPVPNTWGGPVIMTFPGASGSGWVKHVQSITFSKQDQEYFTPDDYTFGWTDKVKESTTLYNYLNAGWFQNDGQAFTLDEGVNLTGYAFAWDWFGGPLTTVSFSTDMGVTWTDFAVPAEHDPKQWTTFDFNWKPTEPGTYIVKVKTDNRDAMGMKHTEGPSNQALGCASILVTVTE